MQRIRPLRFCASALAAIISCTAWADRGEQGNAETWQELSGYHPRIYLPYYYLPVLDAPVKVAPESSRTGQQSAARAPLPQIEKR